MRGRVQGVGYRAFVEHEALKQGIEGWVRNRRDGSVEAVFAGAPEKVEAIDRSLPAWAVLARRVERSISAMATEDDLAVAPAGRTVLGAGDGVDAVAPEQRLELAPQHHVHLRHRHRQCRDRPDW